MQLPEVYIPSFYNAMQQGRADKRTAMINALQDEFMVSSKKVKKDKGLIDKVSATLILQSYLEEVKG